jgi:hypothetical protein
MKTTLKLVSVTSILLVSLSAALAESPCCSSADKGIAASPKLLQTMSDQKACCPALQTQANPVKVVAADQNLAASPKLRQSLASQSGVIVQTPVIATVESRQNGTRVAASPRLQQQLNEQSARPVEIAPLK